MADERDLTPVVLLDRACTGGFEFLYDGRPYVFRKGQVELSTWADVARFVFGHEHGDVFTTAGERVHRLAIKDAPGFEGVAAQLAHELGEEILDDSPVELDRGRIENWDTRGVPRSPDVIKVVPVDVPPSMLRGRDSAAGTHLAGKARG